MRAPNCATGPHVTRLVQIFILPYRMFGGKAGFSPRQVRVRLNTPITTNLVFYPRATALSKRTKQAL
jgi:hypothetical protein